MTARETIENQINAMLMARADALGVKNAADAASHSTDDAVQFGLAPPLVIKGRDEQGMQEWFDTWQGPIDGDVRDVKLTAGEDVAFWTGLVNMTGTKTDGTKVDLWFRQTLGMVKTADGWKVAHEHASVPFAMDGSDRALLDLQP
jgi:ketosteroid isomerase-like protein